MNMKPRSAGESNPRINLINPHTGHFSPNAEDEDEFFHEISGTDNGDSKESLDLKPDPLTLIMGGQVQSQVQGQQVNGSPSPLNGRDGDEQGDEHYQFSEPMFRRKKGGGRNRDPIWAAFHLLYGKTWQCNNCTYKYTRPQPDRMKKHRAKCLKLGNDDMMMGVVGKKSSPTTSKSTPKEGASSSSSLGPENIAQSSSKKTSTVTSESATNIPIPEGMTQFKTNSITRELKRIADALEESNKLKKLKLGLDPHIPFDGGSKNRK